MNLTIQILDDQGGRLGVLEVDTDPIVFAMRQAGHADMIDMNSIAGYLLAICARMHADWGRQLLAQKRAMLAESWDGSTPILEAAQKASGKISRLTALEPISSNTTTDPRMLNESESASKI